MTTARKKQSQTDLRGRAEASRWQGATIDELITAFNREVNNKGTGAARAKYLVSLRTAFLDSGFDCSAFLDDTSMCLDRRVGRDDRRLILL